MASESSLMPCRTVQALSPPLISRRLFRCLPSLRDRAQLRLHLRFAPDPAIGIRRLHLGKKDDYVPVEEEFDLGRLRELAAKSFHLLSLKLVLNECLSKIAIELINSQVNFLIFARVWRSLPVDSRRHGFDHSTSNSIGRSPTPGNCRRCHLSATFA